MNTLRLFDKPTRIIIHAGQGRHISARSLFTHLRDALADVSLSETVIITVHGEGSVSVDDSLVYRPRRMAHSARKTTVGEG